MKLIGGILWNGLSVWMKNCRRENHFNLDIVYRNTWLENINYNFCYSANMLNVEYVHVDLIVHNHILLEVG